MIEHQAHDTAHHLRHRKEYSINIYYTSRVKRGLNITYVSHKHLCLRRKELLRCSFHYHYQNLNDKKPCIMDETIDHEAQDIEHWWQNYGGAWDPTTRGSPPSDEKDSISNRVINLWRYAPSWSTMIELNLRYLTRRLPICASYGQPPDRETDQFSELLYLHEYGIISTNSCPGWELPIHGSSASARQRNFLYFSIPTRNLQTASPHALYNFVHQLMKSSVVRVYIRFQYHDAPDEVQRDPNITGLMPFGSCDNLPDSGGTVWEQEGWDVTIDDDGQVKSFDFTYEQRRQDAEGEWTEHGIYSIDRSDSSFKDDDNPFPASHAADPLQICIVARDWNYRAIGELIKQCLDQSGILPEYGR